MAIKIGQAFERTSANPIDLSLTLTKAQMLAVDDDLMPNRYFTVCQDDGKLYMYDKNATPNAQTGKYSIVSGGGNTESIELTQAQYDALSDDEKNNGTVYFITDGQGAGGGGDQWIVLSKDLVITANELRAIENSKKPIMWFDGYYYTPITSMDVNSEWGYGYIQYFYNNYRYSIGINYDGDDWNQPVTWNDPYTYQVSASLSLVNPNGGVQVSQNIGGKNASMWLYPEWNIPNFVNSRLVLSSSTKTHDLMTRYSQPQNIVKTGEIGVSVHQIGARDSKTVDISDLNFASKDEYRVITTYEQVEGGVVDVMHGIGMRTPSSFTIEAHNMSDSAIFGNALVNYMVLANKYYDLYATSTAITNSTVSGDKFTWAKITTDKTAYNDFSVLKGVANNAKLRVYAPNATTPALAQYDTEGTETQDAEHYYYPIKWANVDGTRTPFDNFVYLARSRRGGQDNDMWLASAPSTDRLDANQCPAIGKVTIAREK